MPCRYKRAIKIGLNAYFNNKQAINKELAHLIADYSHKTLIKKGSVFASNYAYFIVDEVHSQHWVSGYFCPPKMILLTQEQYVFPPDISKKSRTMKKKMFDPYGTLHIRQRKKTFILIANATHKSLQNHRSVL